MKIIEILEKGGSALSIVKISSMTQSYWKCFYRPSTDVRLLYTANIQAQYTDVESLRVPLTFVGVQFHYGR